MKKTSKILIFSFLAPLKKFRKTFFLLGFALLLILPMSVSAFSSKTGDIVYVGKDEVVEGNLYAAGSSITVDGKVMGDVICAGQTININGTVEGDVICAAGTININGPINGSVRAAGDTININSAVARNVMAFGATIIIGSNGSVGWDMLTAGAVGEIRGKIGRDLHGALASAVISGEVAGNVKLQIDDRIQKEKRGIIINEKSRLNITDTAKIGGAVSYTAANDANISANASIGGEITKNTPKARGDAKKDFKALWGIFGLYSIFSALVIGLVLISLWRDEIKKITDKMIEKTGASIGWGIIVMLLTPIIAILLLITLIGIPLAGLLMLFWLIALCLSKIIVGILIGRQLLEKFWKKQKDSMIWAMIIGIIITQIIFSIPLVGWLLCLAAAWWGLGGIYLFFKKG
jgi:cytoskeletal protein CcmA (bactofilin family)